MLWNEEARGFVYLKLRNSDYVRSIKGQIIGPETKPPRERKTKPPRVRRGKCEACDAESACPNCIAKQVTRKKPKIYQNIAIEREHLPGAWH